MRETNIRSVMARSLFLAVSCRSVTAHTVIACIQEDCCSLTSWTCSWRVQPAHFASWRPSTHKGTVCLNLWKLISDLCRKQPLKKRASVLSSPCSRSNTNQTKQHLFEKPLDTVIPVKMLPQNCDHREDTLTNANVPSETHHSTKVR